MVYEHRIWSLRGVYTSLDSQNTCHIPQLTQCYPQNKTASQNSNSSLRTGTKRVWNQPSGAITIAMEQWNFIFEENTLATWLPFGEMELYGCTDDIRLLSSIINHQSSKKWHVIINHQSLVRTHYTISIMGSHKLYNIKCKRVIQYLIRCAMRFDWSPG